MSDFIDFKSELNAEQYEAVCAPIDFPALVLAGAGSGKTRTLTYRVAHFIRELKIPPQRLLLLTFTNKAARQMLERVQALTGVESWRFWGGTFHSVASKFLRAEGASIGLEPDFSIADAEDSEKLLKLVVGECMPKFFANKNNPKAALLKDIISFSRNTCLPMERALQERFSWIETPPEDLEKIAGAYEARKRASKVCDFDDLLELWLKALNEDDILRERYQGRFANVLVDEYQDTNTLQCRILDSLCASGNISAVGDDAQCIYSWRGANIGNILGFKSRYPNAKIYKVGLNYRSTPQILDFANDVLSEVDNGDDFKKSLEPSRADSRKVQVVRAIDAQSQARVVADLIEELTFGASAPYRLSDIAVLYRAHYQAMDMQLQLQYRDISFAITSGLKFFEQAHIKDAISQMKFAANPLDFVSFARFLKFMPKVGDKTCERIFFNARETAEKRNISIPEALSSPEVLAKVPEVSREIFSAMAKDISSLYKSVKISRAPNAMKTDLFDSSAPRVAPKDMVGLVCGGWYLDLMKTAYEDWQDRRADFDSLYEYAARFPDLDMFLASASLEISEGAGDNKELFGERVSLMTVHQAKGLEFPVVFVIGAADGMFPLQRCIDEGDIDEERRLFYVACTRAKDFLVVCFPRVTFGKGHSEMREISRFVKIVKPALYEKNY
ncbi:MAG: ATP-dependent helicase [Opitutales bacterium]|nr:ATP-dependent helicase [Opitutales bacterium]